MNVDIFHGCKVFPTAHTNVAQKVEIIIEHFKNNIMKELGGRAKAMVITSSRQAAVKYRNEFVSYIAKHGYTGIHALVAFSGKVSLDGKEYTETVMNGISEEALPEVFDSNDYQVLLVANKYQTGFDQPKLCAMYVDKRLRGVAAVQTLSRLNRICAPYDKSDNYHILQNMDEIHRAIESNKQMRFQYYGFDMYKKKEYHHFGNEYRVSPFALIYHQGLYTLIAIPARDTRIRFYRIDRMENVVVSRADRLHEEIFNEIDIDRFTSGTFGLHASEVRDVTLKCHKSLVDTIMDRFGADVPFTIVDEKYFEVTVPAVMNADFYGWVFSLGGRIQLIGPRRAVRSFESACATIYHPYWWPSKWGRMGERFVD